MVSAFSLYKRTNDAEATWNMLFGKNHTSIVCAIDEFQPYSTQSGAIMSHFIEASIQAATAVKQIYSVLESLNYSPSGIYFTDPTSKVGGAFTRDH
jgi:hypothetical protein